MIASFLISSRWGIPLYIWVLVHYDMIGWLACSAFNISWHATVLSTIHTLPDLVTHLKICGGNPKPIAPGPLSMCA